MTTPISRTVCRAWAGTCCDQLAYQIEVSAITWNKNMKGHAKCKNYDFELSFGALRGNTQGSSMAPYQKRNMIIISGKDNACKLIEDHELLHKIVIAYYKARERMITAELCPCSVS